MHARIHTYLGASTPVVGPVCLQAFAAEHLGGRPVSLRRDGFTRASVRQVPDLARIASDHVIIGLA